jgi:16S rRNA (guanine527-N7)-methyltransferase
LFRVKVREGSKIVDIGTGGGLPGIPIKILRPDIDLLCLDATKKKVDSVLQMIGDIKITGVHVVWGRAEELSRQAEYLHKFDFAIARAVCQLNELIALSINFLKKRNDPGSFENIKNNFFLDPNSPALIAFKGGDLKQEIDKTKQQFPQVHITTIDLTIAGSEQLIASDKKILLVNM